jgi:hypothetical protein
MKLVRMYTDTVYIMFDWPNKFSRLGREKFVFGFPENPCHQLRAGGMYRKVLNEFLLNEMNIRIFLKIKSYNTVIHLMFIKKEPVVNLLVSIQRISLPSRIDHFSMTITYAQIIFKEKRK